MKKVLLALDGSDQSFESVRYVAKLMPPAETQVNLFHVFSKAPEMYWDLDGKSIMDGWMAKIQAFEEEYRSSVGKVMNEAREILLKSEFREENVFIDIRDRKLGIARDIVKEGNKGYDILFLGRVGQSNLPDMPIGNVTAKVLITLVGVSICVIAGIPDNQKILIAFDGSEGSLRAVDLAGSFLAGRDKETIILKGYSPN